MAEVVTPFPSDRARPPLLKQYHMAVVMLEDAAEMLAARDGIDVGFGSLLDTLARVMVGHFGVERTVAALKTTQALAPTFTPNDSPTRPAA